MVNLPRHTAGRKGGKAPKKKSIARRKAVPSEQRQPLIENDLVTSAAAATSVTVNPNGSAPSCSYDSPVLTTAPSLTVITTSSGNWNWNWDRVPPPSHPITPPYYSPSFPPTPSYPTFYPPPVPYHSPFTDVTNCYHPYLYKAPGTISSPTYTKSPPCNEPFMIKLLNGRIKVCAGCKGSHMKDADNGLLPPPHDICIGHSEPLTFINPRTGLECSKTGNAYYHVSLACIIKKHPDFTPAQIVCSDDVKMLLKEVHFKFLWDKLGFRVKIIS